jgi:hypothetical protein
MAVNGIQGGKFEELKFVVRDGRVVKREITFGRDIRDMHRSVATWTEAGIPCEWHIRDWRMAV